MVNTKDKPKVYLVCTGRWGSGDQAWTAIANDGEVIVQHMSSSRSWGLHDVGPRGFHRKLYEAKFGADFDDLIEVIEVPDKESPPPEVIEANHLRYANGEDES